MKTKEMKIEQKIESEREKTVRNRQQKSLNINKYYQKSKKSYLIQNIRFNLFALTNGKYNFSFI